MLTLTQLLERLAEVDECPEIETKRAEHELGKSALETISAFSNEPEMGGGYLLFGIQDGSGATPPAVVGVADAKKLEQEISSICASGFNRAIRPRVWAERYDGKNVVVAFVPEASRAEKPVFIKSRGMQSGAFRRIGSTDQRCTEDDLRVLFRAGDATAYEDTPVTDATVAELDEPAISSYRRQLLDANPATELRDATLLELVQAVGGARRDGGELIPTIAGVLLFGSRLLLRRLMPQLRVDYIRVPGTQWVPDAERRYDSIEIRDPLLQAFRRAYQGIVDDLPKAFVLSPESPERRERAIVPETVIREALVNALTHRDYRVASAIQVIRYADRIEIRNPGHSLVRADQFGQPGSFPRNPKIADIFREMKLAENKGTGIAAMRRAMKSAALEPPIFDSNARGGMFVTILWFHSLLDDRERAWLDALGLELSAHQRQALVLAHRTGFVTNEGLRDLTGLDPLQARRELHGLREQGLLKMHGERGGAYYVLAMPGPGDVRAIAEKAQEIRSQVRDVSARSEDADRGESPGANRGESEPDREESDADRGESGRDRGELAQLPKDLADAVRKLGKRPRKRPLRAVIARLCGWKTFRPIELGEILNIRPDKLTERHLTPLVEQGVLCRVYPENPNHPEQAYRTRHGELPITSVASVQPADEDEEEA